MEELPVGFRFHPYDVEIINHYLKLKMDGHDSEVDYIIAEVDLCRQEPWDLPGLARVQSDDQVWHFFCRLDYKYRNSKKANRTTRAGFWKATGKILDVKDKNGEVIGTKRTLVFHKKLGGPGPKAVRTDWVIHEYQAKTILPHQTAFVLCKLKNKAYKADDQADGSPSYDEGEPSSLRSSVLENDNTAIPEATLNNPQGSSIEDLLVLNDLLDNDTDNTAIAEATLNNPQGISIEDRLVLNDLLDNDTAFGSSNDELAAIQLADSFLNVPDEYSSGEINCITLDDSNIRKYKHRAVSSNLVAEHQVSPGSIQLQMDTSSAKAREDLRYNPEFGLPRKESFGVDSKKVRETPRVNNAKATSKLRSNESASTHKKSGFIYPETPASSRGPSPPSVYILNVIVGLVLFIIILREMLIFH